MLTDNEYNTWMKHCEEPAQKEFQELEKQLMLLIEKYNVYIYSFDYNDHRDRAKTITSLYWHPNQMMEVIDKNINNE